MLAPNVSLLRLAAVITSVVVGISIPSPSPAYADASREPLLAPSEPLHRNGAAIVHVKATSAMSRCLATWDRSSQMSKQEWKRTCQRVVKENPGLYNKPF